MYINSVARAFFTPDLPHVMRLRHAVVNLDRVRTFRAVGSMPANVLGVVT